MSVEHVQNHVAPSVPADEAQRLESLAARLARSGLVPTDLRGKPNEIALVMWRGREWGIEPLTSLEAIYVINGRTVPAAKVLVGRAKAAGYDIWPEVLSSTRVVAAGCPVNNPARISRVEWTMDDARRAGLDQKEVWRKFPAAMLWARASSMLARALAPEAFVGLSMPTDDELDRAESAEVSVPVVGEVPTVGAIDDSEPTDAEVVVAATADPANDLKVQAAELSAELGLDPAAKAAVCTFAANTTKPTTVDDLTRVVETLKRIQADELILDFSDGEWVILAGSGEQWGEDQ